MANKVIDGYKMSWSNFFANVWVFIGAGLAAIHGADYIITGLFNAVLTSKNFGDALIKVLIGLLCAAPWAWLVWVHFITRKNLKCFNVHAPGDVYLISFVTVIFYAVETILSIVNLWGTEHIASMGVLVPTKSVITISVVWFALIFAFNIGLMIFNYVYFEKRAHLFCNK